MSAPLPTLRTERMQRGKERAARQRQLERIRSLAVQLRTLEGESIPAARRAYENASRAVDKARSADQVLRAGSAFESAGAAYRSLLRLERRVREELAEASGRGAGTNGSARAPARGVS